MPHDTVISMPEMPKEWTIKVLDDGTFTLRTYGWKESFEYSYQSKDELLRDLADELGEDKQKEKVEDESPKSKKAKDRMKEMLTIGEDKEWKRFF